jgi:hypothetical protein
MGIRGSSLREHIEGRFALQSQVFHYVDVFDFRRWVRLRLAALKDLKGSLRKHRTGACASPARPLSLSPLLRSIERHSKTRDFESHQTTHDAVTLLRLSYETFRVIEFLSGNRQDLELPLRCYSLPSQLIFLLQKTLPGGQLILSVN